MKRLASILLCALAMTGAGCWANVPAAPSPAPAVPAPATSTKPGGPADATSTAPVAVIPAGWVREAVGGQAFFHPGAAGTRPGKNDEEAAQGLLLTVDLGTAVERPGTRDVPRRTLKVWAIQPGAPELAASCSSSEAGAQGVSAIRAFTNGHGIRFCLRSSADAGAGNRYDVQSYSLLTDHGNWAFTFVTHSVECSNYEHPAEQCVYFDPVRDTAVFELIMETVQPAVS